MMTIEWEIAKYFILLGGLFFLGLLLGRRGPHGMNPLMLGVPFVAVLLLPWTLSSSHWALRQFAPEPIDQAWLAARPFSQVREALADCTGREFGDEVLPEKARRRIARFIIEKDILSRRVSSEALLRDVRRIVLAHDPLAGDYVRTIHNRIGERRRRLLLLSCAQTRLREAD